MKNEKNLVKGLIGLGLIILAVVPTPDDITIVSPVIQFTYGVKLIGENF